MQFVTVRELSKSPKTALAKLDKDKKMILTNNGKPKALILKISEDDFEQTLVMFQRMEAMQNTNEIRLESMRNGTCNMSDEINAEIKAVRKDRKRRNKNT